MFLTESQKHYYTAMKKLGRKKPQKVIKRPQNPYHALFYDISVSRRFEIAIFVLIFLNMVSMGIEHFDQSRAVTFVLEICNALFTTIFSLGGGFWSIVFAQLLQAVYFVSRVHSEDNRPPTPLLHHSLEPVWLRPRDRLHCRDRDGGPHGGLPRVPDPPQGGQGLQDRQDIEAHPGNSNLNLSLTMNGWRGISVYCAAPKFNKFNCLHATSSELFLRSCYFRLRREFGSYYSRWLSPCRHFSISEPCWRSSLLSTQLSGWRSSATWSTREPWMIWSTLRPSADQCSFCSGLWKKVLSKFYWLLYESEAASDFSNRIASFNPSPRRNFIGNS